MQTDLMNSVMIEVNRMFTTDALCKIGNHRVVGIKVNNSVHQSMKTIAVIVYRDHHGKDHNYVLCCLVTENPKTYFSLIKYMEDLALKYDVPINNHVRREPNVAA